MKINVENCEEIEVELNFYAVRSKDGKFLRAKKHSMYGNFDKGKSWTDNISEAKIYSKPGPARSQCTWWATNYPEFGAPDLVFITTGKCLIVNEDVRVEKAMKKNQLEKLERELRRYVYILDTHLAKVKLMRGDGMDNESVRLRKLVEELQEKVNAHKS